MNVSFKIALLSRINSVKMKLTQLLGFSHVKNGVYYIYGEDEYHWYKDDALHSENGQPSLIDNVLPNRKQWHKNGELHRDNGPAYVFGAHETWYRDGVIHREDGPAIERSVIGEITRKIYSTEEHWLTFGQKHRYDGPATTITEHGKIIREEWLINGKTVDENKYTQWLTNNGIDIKCLTDDDKLLIRLIWGS